MGVNLFIVNSPLHLLESYVLIKSKFSQDDNYLALVHPHGYAKWRESSVMNYLASKNAEFKNIFVFPDKITKKQVDYISNNLKTLGINEVYTGSDFNIADQLILGALGVKSFVRLDDGLGSYFNEDRKRSLVKMLIHKMQIKALSLFLGIDIKFEINTSALGENKSGKADFLFLPRLLKRKSPKVLEIKHSMIALALDTLKDRGFMTQEFRDAHYALYLSQGTVPVNKECVFIREFLDGLL